MKHRLVFTNVLLFALPLAMVTTAMASSTWYVDGRHGSDSNSCKTRQDACKTIGHAISLAHSGDSIMVAAATYAENLAINFSLKIVGSGAKTTIIDGGGVDRVVRILNGSARVALSKVTIRNGLASEGGGIWNLGTLTINRSTISGNTAQPGRLAAVGGGISNSGTLTINNSTLSGNTAQGILHEDAEGGGIWNHGTLEINHSTLSGNSAGVYFGFGGGIYNYTMLTINSSTLSGNRAGFGGGIYDNTGMLAVNNSTISGKSAFRAAGIENDSGTAIFQNTIVANSSRGGNCSGTITSKGYNLSSDGTCNFNNSGDLNNTDPMLGTLGHYGGPTQTIPLLSGSPAIDAGNPSGCTDGNGHLLKTDQRGKPRPDKEDPGGCDMGAYERQKD